MLTKEQIHTSLREMGIQPSDTVLMHTSMRAIGPVEGGCDGLIDAFTAYLSEGLYLIPTHTWDNVGQENPVYDVRKTPPCIGALPTVAAFRPDGVRSLHPTHSMAAFGRGAAAFVAGEEKATSPGTPGGCWARLAEVGAKILLVGVGLNRYTFLHAVDEMLDLPGRLKEPIDLTVIGYGGEQYALHFQKHGNTGSVIKRLCSNSVIHKGSKALAICNGIANADKLPCALGTESNVNYKLANFLDLIVIALCKMRRY
jgi:aminoglycoside 3-N-acetyltransferase